MKLYLVSRADLHYGLAAAQLCHCMREFAERFPAEEREWYEKSNTLVLLEVDNEEGLRSLLDRAITTGVLAVDFREPDLDNALTAVAIGPQGKALCRSLRLALR